MQKPIPTPAKIKSIISKFSDLPQEAEKELKTKQDLHDKIKSQQQEINSLKRQQPKNDPQAIEKAQQLGYQKGITETKKQFVEIEKQYKNRILKLENTIRWKTKRLRSEIHILQTIHDNIETLHDELVEPLDEKLELPKEKQLPIRTDKPIKEKAIFTSSKPATLQTKATVSEPIDVDGVELSGPETKILTAIVQRPEHQGTRNQIALMSEYSPKGSAFRNPVSRLKSLGLIVYQPGNILQATDSGVQALGDYEPLQADNESIQSFWLNKVTGPESKILKPIIAAYPDALSREDCAEQSGYSINGSAFRNPVSHLRSVGLIEYVSEGLIASKELFPDG